MRIIYFTYENNLIKRLIKIVYALYFEFLQAIILLDKGNINPYG